MFAFPVQEIHTTIQSLDTRNLNITFNEYYYKNILDYLQYLGSGHKGRINKLVKLNQVLLATGVTRSGKLGEANENGFLMRTKGWRIRQMSARFGKLFKVS
jgi:hypothetical protein